MSKKTSSSSSDHLSPNAPEFIPPSLTSSNLIDLNDCKTVSVPIPVPIPVPVPVPKPIERSPLIELPEEDFISASPSFDKTSDSAWALLQLNPPLPPTLSTPMAHGSIQIPREGFDESSLELSSTSSLPAHLPPCPPPPSPHDPPKAFFVPSAIKKAQEAKTLEEKRQSSRISDEEAVKQIFMGDPNAPASIMARLPAHCVWFILENAPRGVAMKVKGPVPGPNLVMGINIGLILPSQASVCGISIKGRPMDLPPLSQPPLSYFSSLSSIINATKVNGPQAYELIHWTRLEDTLFSSPFEANPSSSSTASPLPSALFPFPLPKEIPVGMDVSCKISNDEVGDEPSQDPQAVTTPSPPAQAQPRPLRLTIPRPLTIPASMPNQVPIVLPAAPMVPPAGTKDVIMTTQAKALAPTWSKIASSPSSGSSLSSPGSAAGFPLLQDAAGRPKPPAVFSSVTEMSSKVDGSISSSSDSGSKPNFPSAKIQLGSQVKKRCAKVGAPRTDEDRARVQAEVEARNGPEICPIEQGMIHITTGNEPMTMSYDDLFD